MRVERHFDITYYYEGDQLQITAFRSASPEEWAVEYLPASRTGWIEVAAHPTREEAETHAEALFMIGVWK